MATNKQILDAHSRFGELTAKKRELEATIKNAKKKLERVQEDLELAKCVDEIIDGIAIHVQAETPTMFEMETLASGPNVTPRDVHAYQVASGTNWAVRVNGGDFKKRLFHGGEVLGLGCDWSRQDALEVAKRWLTGDDSVLVA